MLHRSCTAPGWGPLLISLIPLSMGGPLCIPPSVPSVSSSSITASSASPQSPPCRWCQSPQHLLGWETTLVVALGLLVQLTSHGLMLQQS